MILSRCFVLDDEEKSVIASLEDQKRDILAVENWGR